MARDLTRYDILVGRSVHSALPKRRAVLELIRALVQRGVSPERIDPALRERGETRATVLGAAGNLSSPELGLALTRAAAAAGTRFDAMRWFLGEDELIRREGSTWCATNQFGIRKTEPTLLRLMAAFPDRGVSWRRSTDLR